MAIAIRQTSDQIAKADGYLDSLTKLVPGDVLLAYTAALQLRALGDDGLSHWIILGLFALLTPFILHLSSHKAGVKAPPLQYAIRTVAFALLAMITDPVVGKELGELLGRLLWIPNVGALVVVALAAYIVTPAIK